MKQSQITNKQLQVLKVIGNRSLTTRQISKEMNRTIHSLKGELGALYNKDIICDGKILKGKCMWSLKSKN